VVELSVVKAVKRVMPRTPVPTPIGGQQRAEGDRQDDQRDDDPDQLRGAPDLGFFFARGAAELDVDAPLFDRRECFLQLVALARLDHVPFVFELDLGERVAAVLGDPALRFERVGDRDDAGRLAGGRHGAFDRRRVVFDLTTARGGEDDLAGGAAGGGELRFQQVDRLLGARTGDLEFFREGLRDGAADDAEEDEHADPEGENAASAAE
jgi:hypothetical protein